MKKLFLLLAVIITFALSAAAQNRTVSGTVVSADNGEPLIGATVLGVGTQMGAATDIDGNFSLSLPASVKKLSVSYVGMVTRTVDITPEPMTIALESSNMLDEVITVAYGTQKRSSFTGSASVVDASQIEAVQVTNPIDALAGKVAGVQINNTTGAPGNSSPTIFIRGISSVNAGNEPLIVVDGTPFPGDLNTIATQDIESMTVLKDAASNALYGARGANGVILITTKKGKGNAKVTFDAKWGQNSRATPDYDIISDPRQYYDTYARAMGNSFSAAYGAGGTSSPASALAQVNQYMVNRDLGYPIWSVPEGENLIVDGYKLNPNATLGNVYTTDDGQEWYLTPDNWTDFAYRKSLRQEYSLSVSQATDKGSFYFSTNYLNNEGISYGSGYERITSRLSADIQAKPWLKVGANMSYSHYNTRSLSGEDGDAQNSSNVFSVANVMAPIYPIYIRDGQGNIMTNDDGVIMYDFGDMTNAGLSRPVFAQANPFADNRLNVNKLSGNAFNGNAFAEIRFLKDFKFTTNNAVSVDETRYNDVTNPYFGSYAESNGIVSVQHVRSYDYTFQQLLNWTRDFGNHNVTALFGHETYWSKGYVLYASNTNMLLPNNTELDGAITTGNTSSYTTAYNNEGWFARVNYDYDDKYFASASFRRDASSRFHPDHRWGSFWSAGAAWIISKEKFMESTESWLDMLKLKASYGEQGNDRIGPFRYTNTYTIENSNGTPSAQPYRMGNPNISWEKGGNFNAGADFSLWGERLTGTIEYFYRKTSDMLFWFPLPPSFGYTSYVDNIGDMTNKGIEIELRGDVYRSKNMRFGLSFNLTHYKNKITRLAETSKTRTVDGVDGYSSGSFYFGEGKSIYTFIMPSYAGVDSNTGLPTWWSTKQEEIDGVLQWEDAEKTIPHMVPFRQSDYSKISSDDYHLQGSAIPSVTGGFGINGEAYGFDFMVDFGYQIGGKVYDSTYASLVNTPQSDHCGYALHKDVLKAWTPENPNSDFPRLVYGDKYMGSNSNRFLIGADYLSVNTINVGYTIPSKLTKKLQVDRIRVYFNADNVALWSRRKGLDPRQGMAVASGDQNVTGESSGAFYSPIRTISGGINVTF